MISDAASVKDITARLEAALRLHAPEWLEAQRWYGDKGKAIALLQVEALQLEEVGAELAALAIVKLQFSDGDVARYCMPMAIDPTGIEQDPIHDALTAPWFGSWLLSRFYAGQDDAWHADVGELGQRVIGVAAHTSAVVMRGEQSNTSVRYGDVLMVKLFRKLQAGPNPDEEALRALAEDGFRAVPPFAGSLFWTAASGDVYPLALAQAYVPNVGDGWSWLMARLHTLSALPDGEINVFPARQLGERTAELHMALSAVSEPDFLPRAATQDEIAADIARTYRAGALVEKLLIERETALPETLRARLPEILAKLPEILADSAGFREELGLPRIRTHGDFHLGQTLRTADDWVLIDFEGEPARPVAERRARASALKDVAGMLRSFSYARAVAEREARDSGDQDRIARLAQWEAQAREAFIAGYRAADGELAPQDDESFTRALRAWEVEKALYEVMYEARNRPGWLAIPVEALLAGHGPSA